MFVVSGFSLCAALCAVATIVTAANIGGEPRTCDDFWITIESKEDIDFYQTCKTIEGEGFFVSHNWTGPFEMSGLESIPRFSSGYQLPKLPGSDRVDDGVTTISMPDLRNIAAAGFLIGYVDAVTSISFPKLESIDGYMGIVDNSNLTNITFPSLKSVNGGIILEGNFEVINLPSLKSAQYLRIRSTNEKLDCRALGRELGPQLNITATEDDIDLGAGWQGFTCRGGYDDNNWFNSSEPVTTGGNGDSPGGSSVGSGNRGNDKNAAGVLSVEYGLGAVLFVAGVMFCL